MVVMGWSLDLVILVAFSNFNYPPILPLNNLQHLRGTEEFEFYSTTQRSAVVRPTLI